MYEKGFIVAAEGNLSVRIGGLPVGGRPTGGHTFLVTPAGRAKGDLRDIIAGKSLDGLKIATGEHCYGCAAGQGSSCGGALEP